MTDFQNYNIQQEIQEEEMDNEYDSYNSNDDDEPFSSRPISADFPRRKRGRPKKSESNENTKATYKKKKADNQDDDEVKVNSYYEKKKSRSQSPTPLNGSQDRESVRSIPCFYADCTYSYKRPGSSIVEISDRPLVLTQSKFDGYIIRACKKHHDKWKHAESRSDSSVCDVCRDLNAVSMDDHSEFINKLGVSFHLCSYCSYRQSSILGIQSNGNKTRRIKPESDEEIPGEESSDYHDSNKEDDDKSEDEHDLPDNEDDDDLIPNKKENLKSSSIKEREDEPESKSGPKGKKGNLNKKRKNLVFVYNLFKQNDVQGWENTNIKYSSICEYDEPTEHLKNSAEDENESQTITEIDKESPFKFSIRKLDENSGEVGVFAETEINESSTIGEYIGKFTERKKTSDKKHTYNLSKDVEIDTSSIANEISMINPETSSKEANIRFDHVKGRLLAVTLRKIEVGEELIGDYVNCEYRDRENSYLEIFARIEDFNQKHLTVDERSTCAFQWFLEDGYELLKSKAKITVPIGNRVPSKKGLASNLTPKRYSHVTKDQSEWGYVAQYEMLDMERAREDCWVTFKAGKNLSWEDLEQAITTWKADPSRVFADSKSSYKAKEKERENNKDSLENLLQREKEREENSGKSQGMNRSHVNAPIRMKQEKLSVIKKKQKVENPLEFSEKEYKLVKRDTPLFLKEHINQKVRYHSSQDRSSPSVGQHIQHIDLFQKYKVQEIKAREVKFDAEKGILGTGQSGYIFKGFWRGYPCAIRFPYPNMSVTADDPKEKLLSHCSNFTVSHPNITQFYGVCQKEQLCMISEYMNLGSLKKYLSNLMNSQYQYQYQFYGMYIPRIALDVARGMEFLHSKNILHRNLKSSNVLMKGELLDNGLIASMEIKISEYGVDTDQSLQFASKEIKDMDSLCYFAPEIIESRKHTFQSDVYSFGMVLCHLFSEGTEKPKLPSVVIQESHYLKSWDPNWKELITRCTNVDPQRRPSFTEILDIIFELLANASRDFMQ